MSGDQHEDFRPTDGLEADLLTQGTRQADIGVEQANASVRLALPRRCGAS